MGRAEQKADVLVKDQSPGDVKNEVSSRPEDAHSFRLLSAEDKHGFMLLVLLYMLQGIPVGLAFGTMPFLLKSHVVITPSCFLVQRHDALVTTPSLALLSFVENTELNRS